MKKDPRPAEIFPDARVQAAWDALKRERFGDAYRLLSAVEPTPQIEWGIGVALHGQNRHHEALDVLRGARRHIADPRERWRCAIDLAIAHNKRGAARTSERLLRVISAACLALGDHAAVAKCELYAAITLARRGRYDAFLAALTDVERRFGRLLTPDLRAIGMVSKCASLASLQRYDEARAVTSEGIVFAREHDLTYRQALFAYYACYIGFETGVDIPDARAVQNLDMLCGQTGARLLEIDCLTLKANLAYARGDVANACAIHTQAAAKYEESGYLAGAAWCLANVAIIEFARSRYAEALRAIARAADHARAGDSDDAAANALYWFGRFHAVLHNEHLAIPRLQAAYDTYERIGQWPRALSSAALLALADQSNAEKWLAEAARLEKRCESSAEVANALRWMAESRWRLGQILRAQALFVRAGDMYAHLQLAVEHHTCQLAWCALALETGGSELRYVRQLIADAETTVADCPELVGQALLLKAELFQRDDASDTALQLLLRVAQSAAEIRDGLLDPVLAGRVAHLQRRNYATAMRLAAARGDLTRLALLIGLRRSHGLRWQLAGADQTHLAASPDASQTLDEITRNRLHRRIKTAHGADAPEPLNTTVAAGEREATLDVAAMARLSGSGVIDRVAQAQSVVADIRARMNARFGAGWAVVSLEPLTPIEQAWLVLRVTPDGCDVRRIALTPVIEHVLALLANGDPKFVTQTYANGRNAVMMRRRIAEWLGVDHWVSAPAPHPVVALADTWPLSAIAVGALPLASGQSLSELTTLVHAPLMWSQPRACGWRGKRALVVAPIDFDGRYPALPASDGEITSTTRLWPDAHVLRGNAASLGAMRALAAGGELAKFDVIVLATHAAFAVDQPRFSTLALHDGDLSVHELSQWRLGAALVCVSACDSGRTARLGGEERMGIADTLLYCGAQTVVSPLWAVSDRSAGQFASTLLARYHSSRNVYTSFVMTQSALRGSIPSPDLAAWQLSSIL